MVDHFDDDDDEAQEALPLRRSPRGKATTVDPLDSHDENDDEDLQYDHRREVDPDEEDLRYEDHRWEDPGDDDEQAQPIRRTQSDGSGKRPGTFAPGHQKLGGRKRGTPNRKRMISTNSVVTSADKLGFDRRGKDGILGYLIRIAQQEPNQYVKVLIAALEIEFRAERFDSPAIARLVKIAKKLTPS